MNDNEKINQKFFCMKRATKNFLKTFETREISFILKFFSMSLASLRVTVQTLTPENYLSIMSD